MPFAIMMTGMAFPRLYSQSIFVKYTHMNRTNPFYGKPNEIDAFWNSNILAASPTACLKAINRYKNRNSIQKSPRLPILSLQFKPLEGRGSLNNNTMEARNNSKPLNKIRKVYWHSTRVKHFLTKGVWKVLTLQN